MTKRHIAAARRDLLAGLAAWRIWDLLARQEIRQRYRRSLLGPFWLTISMAVQMVTMGVVVATLFGQSVGQMLPYVCLGLIFWTMTTGIVTDGALAFVSSNNLILHLRIPLTAYVIQCLWRNIIIAGHNMVVYVVIAVIYAIILPPSPAMALIVVTLPLALWSMSWVVLFLAVISTRFRDLPTMVGTGLNVLFWLTPIVYTPDQLGSHRWLATLNPLAHVLDLVRLPLLNQVPTRISFLIVIAMGAIGWTVSFLLFARFRARIPFWL